MERSELLALYDRCQRVEIEYPDMKKEVLPRIVRFLRPAPGSSRVAYSRLDTANADSQIDEQLAFFRHQGLPFSWPVYAHDSPPDLIQRLAARGLLVDEGEEVLVLDLEQCPESLLGPPLALVRHTHAQPFVDPPGDLSAAVDLPDDLPENLPPLLPEDVPDRLPVEIRQLTTAEELHDVEHVLAGVWGGSFAWVHQRLGSHLQIPGYLYLTAAYVGGQPASVAWVYFYGSSPFAGLYGGSTLAAYRGRGLYSALLAARAQEARRRGCRYLTIDASAMSAPIARRHGFTLLTRVQDCDWRPA